jgi:hypothetical protein
MLVPKEPSKRDRMRAEAARLLRDADGQALHVSEIASRILPALGLTSVSVKDLNTALHDDPERRFVRVAKGTWKLSLTPMTPRFR